MAYNALEIRKLKKEKPEKFNTDEFYRGLSAESGCDKEVVTRIYQAMTRYLTRELKHHGFARLPFLGDFGMIKRKPGIMNKGNKKVYGECQMLRFYPNARWKEYFSYLNKWKE